MATIHHFEDLEIWKLARQLAKEIYLETKKSSFNTDNDLKWQIRKSSGSVMDNIAEGFERDGKKEFIQFLSIAKGSAGEVRSQLHRAIDREHITNDQHITLCEKTLELSKKISRFISYLKSTEHKGIKYKK